MSSRGSGLVFFGGLIGGAVGVILWACWRGFLGWTALFDSAAAPIAIGYAVGRIGCQVSGDGDYGQPSDLPWAMAYPHGTVPTTQEVHPTPVYETFTMGLVTLLLWNLRDRLAPGMVFGLYLFLGGLERFLVEFIRRNDAVLAGLTIPQLFSVAMMAGGAPCCSRAVTCRAGRRLTLKPRSGRTDRPISEASRERGRRRRAGRRRGAGQRPRGPTPSAVSAARRPTICSLGGSTTRSSSACAGVHAALACRDRGPRRACHGRRSAWGWRFMGLATSSTRPPPTWTRCPSVVFTTRCGCAIYPCAYLALLVLIRQRVGHTLLATRLDGLVCGLAAAALLATVSLPLAVDATAGAPFWETATSLSYTVCDLILLGAVVSAIALAGWRVNAMWILLGTAVLAWEAGDLMYLFAGLWQARPGR